MGLRCHESPGTGPFADATDRHDLRWIRRLNTAERDELIHRLSALGPEPTIRELREVRFADGLRCPHCQGTEVVRWAKFAQKHRYPCKAEGYGRTFNDLTGTPRAYSVPTPLG